MATRRITPILVLSAALLIWSPPAALSVENQALSIGSSQDEATEQEAIRFRQSFGLRADVDFVQATRRDKD